VSSLLRERKSAKKCGVWSIFVSKWMKNGQNWTQISQKCERPPIFMTRWQAFAVGSLFATLLL
jgi:hypothetical protein